MTSRARVRVGRMVAYNPTAAEETANGVGPWPATIVEAHMDGTADLLIYAPDSSSLGSALADPLTTTAASAVTAVANATAAATADAVATVLVDATDDATVWALANDLKALYNQAVTLLNEVKDTANDSAALANDLKAKYNAAVTLINESKTDTNALVTRLNQLVTGSGASRKNAVEQGTTGGTFSLTGIPVLG